MVSPPTPMAPIRMKSRRAIPSQNSPQPLLPALIFNMLGLLGYKPPANPEAHAFEENVTWCRG